jgi:hypothetical protein
VSHDYRAPDEQPTEYTAVRVAALPREAQLRLEYYERFGTLLQQQVDAIVTRAAATGRELEREQAEATAQMLRVRQETATLREEGEALRRETAMYRAESAAVREESEREQALMREQLARLRTDIEALLEERDRRQAELNQVIQERRREQAELAVAALRVREELSNVESQRNQARAEATTLLEEIDRVRREQLPLVAEVARLKEEAQSLREECERRRQEAAEIMAEAHTQATQILGGVEEGAGAIVTRTLQELEGLGRPITPRSESAAVASAPLRSGASWAEDGAGDVASEWNPHAGGESAGFVPAEHVETTTRLVVREATADEMWKVRERLGAMPGVIRTEPDPSDWGGTTLRVTHALGGSLMGIMLDAGDLDFDVLASGDDFLEINLLRDD